VLSVGTYTSNNKLSALHSLLHAVAPGGLDEMPPASHAYRDLTCMCCLQSEAHGIRLVCEMDS
jgi:hypothetical protein